MLGANGRCDRDGSRSRISLSQFDSVGHNHLVTQKGDVGVHGE